MDPQRVSVVVATRNRAPHLRRALESVIAQSYPDLEIVVVDDASTDGTKELIERFVERDPRVKAVRQTERIGAARGRNLGVQASRGQFLAFLDDDCVWASEKIATQLSRVTSERGVVYTRQAILDRGRWIVEGAAGAEDDALDALLRTNYVGTPSLLVQRELFNQVGGFDVELPRLQDWDLALRLARVTRFAFVPLVLVQGFQGTEGISRNRNALRVAAERMIQRHAPHLDRRQLAALHYGLAKFLLVDGVTASARNHFAQATRLNPGSLLHWAGIAAGLIGPQPARLVRAWRRWRQRSRFEPFETPS